MYGNQIIKDTVGFKAWQTEAYTIHQTRVTNLVKECKHFYFGSYTDIEENVAERFGKNKRLFMDGNDLKLPYDTFLLCFDSGHQGHVKYAMLVQRYVTKDIGITIEFLISNSSNGSKQWILLPIRRLYMFNQTLETTRKYWKDMKMKIKYTIPLYNTNTCIFSFVSQENAKEFNSGDNLDIQRTMVSVLNYFLLLYNQKYIVTETIHRDKPHTKRKKNKTRLFDYKILCVQLPKSGKKYCYSQQDTKSKGIMPFSEVPGIWKTYTEEGGGMFGNPKLTGDYWIPEHVRGSKQAGFVSKDYCIRVS